MTIIALACGASAVQWLSVGAYAAAFAFLGFGAGYVGLAVLFAR